MKAHEGERERERKGSLEVHFCWWHSLGATQPPEFYISSSSPPPPSSPAGAVQCTFLIHGVIGLSDFDINFIVVYPDSFSYFPRFLRAFVDFLTPHPTKLFLYFSFNPTDYWFPLETLLSEDFSSSLFTNTRLLDTCVITPCFYFRRGREKRVIWKKKKYVLERFSFTFDYAVLHATIQFSFFLTFSDRSYE